MTNLTELLRFLDGRKAIILAVVGVIIGYLTTASVIDPNLATAILSILNILAGGAVYATDKILGNRNDLGVRVK